MTIGRQTLRRGEGSRFTADAHRRVLDPVTSSKIEVPAADEWLDEAACRVGGPWQPVPSREFAELFDDEVDRPEGQEETPAQRRVRHRKAYEVCVSCPVAPQCEADRRSAGEFRAGRSR